MLAMCQAYEETGLEGWFCSTLDSRQRILNLDSDSGNLEGDNHRIVTNSQQRGFSQTQPKLLSSSFSSDAFDIM
jgi:hypothetical protein